VLHDDGAAVPLTIPRQKGETDLAVKEVKIGGSALYRLPHEEEARKDAEAARAAGRPQRKLATGAKSLVANTGYRRSWLRLTPRGSPSTRQRSRRMRSSMVSSCCAPACPMSALAVVLRYRSLLTVNRVFSLRKPC